MNKETCFILAILTGTAVAMQAGINAQLNTVIKNPVATAFISFFTDTVALFVYLCFTAHQSLPLTGIINKTSWWKFSGGLLGGFYITAAIFIVPKIDPANNIISFKLAGQLLTPVVINHFRLLNLPVKTISAERIAGIVLIFTGSYLIRKINSPK